MIFSTRIPICVLKIINYNNKSYSEMWPSFPCLIRKNLGSAQRELKWAGGSRKHEARWNWGSPFLCKEAHGVGVGVAKFKWKAPKNSDQVQEAGVGANLWVSGMICREAWGLQWSSQAVEWANHSIHHACSPRYSESLGISAELSGMLLVFDFLSVRDLAGNGWLQLQPALSSLCPPSEYSLLH